MEFQWFFTALSVRPGSSLAMTAWPRGSRWVVQLWKTDLITASSTAHAQLLPLPQPLTGPLVAMDLVRLDDHRILPLHKQGKKSILPSEPIIHVVGQEVQCCAGRGILHL